MSLASETMPANRPVALNGPELAVVGNDLHLEPGSGPDGFVGLESDSSLSDINDVGFECGAVKQLEDRSGLER